MWRRGVSLAGSRISSTATHRPPGTAVTGVTGDSAAEPHGFATARNLYALSPRCPNGRGVPGRSVRLVCASGRRVDLVIPPYAKREQRFSAEGGRKPKGERGERSQGRSARRGTRSAQARFWERGRSGRSRAERRRVSLTLRGMRPRYFAPVGGRGFKRRLCDRSEAEPESTRLARMPRCPKGGNEEGSTAMAEPRTVQVLSFA